MKREKCANNALSETARMRAMSTINAADDAQMMSFDELRYRCREAARMSRVAPVGTRDERNAAEQARDVFAERQQQLIEMGLWPGYER
jgi:hypothetical protein